MTKISYSRSGTRRTQSTIRSTTRVFMSRTPTLSSGSTTHTEPFDIAIVDFPDPNNFALGKLYTTRFYNLLKKN